MRTESINQHSPWLEQHAAEGKNARIELDRWPFTLGRNESCDFQIECARVSREHAEFDYVDGNYLLRDLGSTNGTFVNGRKCSREILSDGDVVSVADQEFCFRCEVEHASRRTVTQPMQALATGDTLAETKGDHLLRQRRREIEAALCGGGVPELEPVVKLADHTLLGYRLKWRMPDQQHESLHLLPELAACRFLKAEELLARLPEHLALFAPLPVDFLRQQFSAPAGNGRLVWQISCQSNWRDHDYRGMSFALTEFRGSFADVKDAPTLPDYLFLAAGMQGMLRGGPNRKRQLESLFRQAEETTTVVAGGVTTGSDAEAWRQLGCVAAIGPYFADLISETFAEYLSGCSPAAEVVS